MKTIVFITTDSITIPWHLSSLIKAISINYRLFVIGNAVSKFSKNFSNVNFIDIKIERKINLYRDFIALYKVFFILLKLKPVISHSFFPKAGLISAIAAYCAFIPYRFHTFTGQTWLNDISLRRYFLKYIDVLINKLNTCCLADSISQADLLYINNIKSNNNTRLRVLGFGSLSGVDIDSIKKINLQNDISDIRLKYDINYDSFIFCYMARKTKVKGAVDILRAFQIVNSYTTNVKLLYIGPDEDGICQNLKLVSLSLFNNVIDIPEVSNIYSFLSISNVLCIPSMMEGFGTVVLDAGAVGRPAIGYRVTGLMDSINHFHTGLLSEPGDTKKFAENMILLRNNIEFTKLLGNNARERVNTLFNANFVSTNLSKFYLEYLY